MRSRIMMLLLFATIANSYSQWNTDGADLCNKNTGNAGIGTTNPNQKITVSGTI
jgi:hypothetical protein